MKNKIICPNLSPFRVSMLFSQELPFPTQFSRYLFAIILQFPFEIISNTFFKTKFLVQSNKQGCYVYIFFVHVLGNCLRIFLENRKIHHFAHIQFGFLFSFFFLLSFALNSSFENVHSVVGLAEFSSRR